MRRVYARAIATKMIDLEAMRDRTDEESEGDVVRHNPAEATAQSKG